MGAWLGRGEMRKTLPLCVWRGAGDMLRELLGRQPRKFELEAWVGAGGCHFPVHRLLKVEITHFGPAVGHASLTACCQLQLVSAPVAVLMRQLTGGRVTPLHLCRYTADVDLKLQVVCVDTPEIGRESTLPIATCMMRLSGNKA